LHILAGGLFVEHKSSILLKNAGSNTLDLQAWDYFCRKWGVL